MILNINRIQLALPFRMGSVNSYLISTDNGFFLIDTGGSNKRRDLEKELVSEGCNPGDLNLVLLTHGDFDHAGNAAYLRDRFKARIALHPEDIGMVEHGDMFWSRKRSGTLLGKLIALLSGYGKAERFVPDITIGGGDDLAEYGLDAAVLSLPGHSRGSVGILTQGGDLFCGDLLENVKEPGLGSIMDDMSTAQSSLDKLDKFVINMVYPGHGDPFAMEQLT